MRDDTKSREQFWRNQLTATVEPSKIVRLTQRFAPPHRGSTWSRAGVSLTNAPALPPCPPAPRADRLVDVAQSRERAAEVARDLGRDTASATPTAARQENLQELENRISTADAEISGTYQELLDLRAKVVRISIDTENPARANDLNASLDGLNARLEALSELMAPQEES